MPYFFFNFIFFLEREEGREEKRERNIYVQEKHQLVAFHMPPLGMWPATQVCALAGNRTSNLLVRRLACNPLSHTSQG